MKRLAVLLLVLALAGPALAEDEVLIGGDIESGGYGAVVVKYGRIMGADGVFVGGQGGWIINHSFVLGLGGYGLANNIGIQDSDCLFLGFGYGGLLLEYIVASQKLVHFSVQVLIGGGGVSYFEAGHSHDHSIDEGDAFFALEPGGNLMLNLHKHVRVGVGGTYRYVGGADYKGLSDSDLSGFTGHIIVKFGSF
jgi:hypothetical protein